MVYKRILAPFNLQGNHWELLLVCPQEHQVLYLNPFGELIGGMKKILTSWKVFIGRRFKENLDGGPPDKWSLKITQHAKQKDSVSCGVFIMKVYNYLKAFNI